MALPPESIDLIAEADFDGLTARAEAADREPSWPSESWEIARRSGSGMGDSKRAWWPRTRPRPLAPGLRTAGRGLLDDDIYSEPARRGDPAHLRQWAGRPRTGVLRPLACGGRFATVGLSQLTTSRQHGGPAMRIEETPSGLILDGAMPWVTGADCADHLITGGVLADGRQMLLALPGDVAGVTVLPPMDLSALAGSRTAEVTCRRSVIDRHWLLAGPAEAVYKSGGRGGTGGLETSCLALGLAGAAIDRLHEEAKARPDLSELANKLEADRTRVRHEMHHLAGGGAGSPVAALELRALANALVLRATQAALTACKGAGFVHPHPAQRWARQALFFLVWSCPRPAAEATMAHLLGECPG